MAIVGMMMVWESAQLVATPILAVHKYVDKIIVCDGAFKQLHDIGYAKCPHSRDATKEIVTALKRHVKCEIVWIDCKDYWPSEVAKKNFMNQYLNVGDWHFHMCADEIPYGDLAAGFKHVRNEKKGGLGHVYMDEPHFKKGSFYLFTRRWKMRFILWGKGFRWKKYHYALDRSQALKTKGRFNITEMGLLHLKFGRPPHRVKAMNLYESKPH